MAISFRFIMDLASGLHARPASMLADTVRRHHSSAALTNLSTGAAAEARSVLSMIGLDIQRGHTVLFEAFGDDEEDLLKAIKQLVAKRFGETAGTASVERMDGGEIAFEPLVPEPIAVLGLKVIGGRPVSKGVGRGTVVRVGTLKASEAESKRRAESADAERVKVDRAFERVHRDLETRASAAGAGQGGEILKAHVGIISDPALRARVETHVLEGRTAACAVIQACEDAAGVLKASTSAYIRDRVGDIDDICRQIVREIDPSMGGSGGIELKGESVVVAETLGVSQLMGMDRALVRGLVLGAVGETSHTVILARSMQIPTLVGVKDLTAIDASEVIVDAVGGYVLVGALDAAQGYFNREVQARARRRERYEPVLRAPGRTKDGISLEVAGNAAGEVDVRAAMHSGADGIGLLRTELLFVDQPQPPDEERQLDEYRRAVAAANGKTVIFRTLDIGGDKPAPYLSLAREENPFLGERGIRLYAKFPGLIRSQLRAICRASGGEGRGKVKVMAPMVANAAEARWFCEQINEVQRELAGAGVDHDPHMPIGVMIEVPSATAIIDQLSHLIDFVSIGTNDLAQYWSAADRMSAVMAGLNSPRQPAFLRVLRGIIRDAREHGLWVGICGEMAADPLNVALIAAMGPNEVSVSSGAVGEIKARLSLTEVGASTAVLEKALECETVEQVENVLAEASRAMAAAGPLTMETIVVSARAGNKHEAIHMLSCLLHGADRATDPRELERKVWAREKTYATGLGHGFAIPHARTSAVSCPTIGIVRLEEGIDWGAMDGEKVNVVIMIAVPEMDAEQSHMKILAKLARRLMHESFRDAVRNAPDASGILSVLKAELELV